MDEAGWKHTNERGAHGLARRFRIWSLIVVVKRGWARRRAEVVVAVGDDDGDDDFQDCISTAPCPYRSEIGNYFIVHKIT